MSNLGVRLGLMPGLGVGLEYGRGFSVVGRRPVGGVRSDIRVWGWGLGIRMSIKAFVNAINCYVSDLKEGEKTLLLHEGERKLSRV